MISRRLLCTALALSPATALAQSGDPKFDAFLRTIRAEALKAGVDAGTLDMALAKVHEVPRVMELARNQPEFKMTFDRYLEIVVSDERVKNGRARLAENRALVSRFAGPAGIPPFDRGRAVGHREQLRQEPRRLRGDRGAGDPGLQQLPRPVLPPAAHGGAEDPGPGARLLREHEGLVGRRDGAVPVHPDELPRLCRGRRWRWPHGHLDQQGRRLRLGLQLPAARRLAAGRVAGARKCRPARGRGRASASCGRPERAVPTFLTTANFQAILRWNQSDFFALAVGLLSDKIAAAR